MGAFSVTIGQKTSVVNIGNTGPRGPQGAGYTFRGVYSSSTAYSALDTVTLSGSSYVAVVPSTGVTPGTDPTKWSLLASKGDTGDKGDKGDTGDVTPAAQAASAAASASAASAASNAGAATTQAGIATAAATTATAQAGAASASASAAATSAINAQTGVPNRGSIRAAKAVSLPSYTYANGAAGVGATITAVANGVFPTVDGQTLNVGDRFLHWDATGAGGSNVSYGVYTLTSAGSATTPWVATRATDCDAAAKLGFACWLTTSGAQYSGYAFRVVNDPATITMGTTAISIVASSNTSGVAGEAVARAAGDAAIDANRKALINGVDPAATQKLMRWRDALSRLILDLDADATVGMTMHVPLNLLPGTVNYSALDAATQAQLPMVLTNEIVGYLYRVLDANKRMLIGVPKDASQPIQAYVSRAATADTGGAVVAETANYYVEQFKDSSGVQQLRARLKFDNSISWKTSGSIPATSPTATPDGMILYQLGTATQWVDPSVGVSYPPLATTDLVLYGDSMTATGSGYGDNMPALYPSRAVYNEGIGGQRTASIAVRFGVPGLTLAITGNQIPTSGSVACVPNIPMLAAGSVARVSVGGILCDLATPDATNYTLTPVTPPSSAVAVANPAPATITTAWVAGTSAAAATPLTKLQQGVLIIRTGKNDIGKTDYSQASVLAYVQSMVATAKARAKSVIVMGVTNGYADLPTTMGGNQPDQVTSDTRLSQIAALNAALAAAHGSRFIDPLANHIALGGGAAQTVNGNTYVVLTNTVLVDGIHENATGKANTAALVQAAINSRGY